jgi:hypothetical protein
MAKLRGKRPKVPGLVHSQSLSYFLNNHRHFSHCFWDHVEPSYPLLLHDSHKTFLNVSLCLCTLRSTANTTTIDSCCNTFMVKSRHCFLFLHKQDDTDSLYLFLYKAIQSVINEACTKICYVIAIRLPTDTRIYYKSLLINCSSVDFHLIDITFLELSQM